MVRPLRPFPPPPPAQPEADDIVAQTYYCPGCGIKRALLRKRCQLPKTWMCACGQLVNVVRAHQRQIRELLCVAAPASPPRRTRTVTNYCPRCGFSRTLTGIEPSRIPDNWTCAQCGTFTNLSERVHDAIYRGAPIDPARERQAEAIAIRNGVRVALECDMCGRPQLPMRPLSDGELDRLAIKHGWPADPLKYCGCGGTFAALSDKRTVRPRPSDVYSAGTIVRMLILAVAAAVVAIWVFCAF